LSAHRFWTAAGLQLAYFGGLARLTEFSGRGHGLILRFERVRPARRDRFQPLRAHEITPQFLDRLLRALKRWDCDVISPQEICDRIVRGRGSPRFACLTFDGGTRDLIEHGYPVLERHNVPFTVYLPTAFPDGLGEAWWLGLEQVIAGADRIALVLERNERRFDTMTIDDKHRVFAFLGSWLRTLPPAELSAAIHDLCKRYGVDLARLSREAAMNWDDVARLAADPNVTIGSATVNYQLLARDDDATALKEITMGRAVLRTALGREPAHFAYPSGDRGSFTRRHVAMVEEAGFVTAVTAIPGVIATHKPPDLRMLPRIPWDGRNRSLRSLRVVLAGLMPDAAALIGRAP
jgi:peptidoglycan/xylan/chitin deacetylase (PgdA/CDA1 family)